MGETNTTTTMLYKITYIFSDLGRRLSDLLILGIIFRTICESSTSSLSRRLPVFFTGGIVICAMLSAAPFGMYIYRIVMEMTSSYYRTYNDLYERYYVDLAYATLYFALSLVAGALTSFVFLRERSKVSATTSFAMISKSKGP